MLELGRREKPIAGYLNPYQRLRLAQYQNWLRQYIHDLEVAVGDVPLPSPLPRARGTLNSVDSVSVRFFSYTASPARTSGWKHTG